MIDDIVTHLRQHAATCAVFKTIAGAADYAALYEKKPQRHETPAVYVLPMRERGLGVARATGVNVQKRMVTFGVALVVPAAGDVRGAKAVDTLEGPRAAIDAAFSNWKPSAAIDVIAFTEGRHQLLADGFLWWLDSYTTQTETRTPVTY